MSPTFKLPVITFPLPSSYRLDVPSDKVKLPGLTYSPNIFDGIEITPTISSEPVGKYLFAGNVVER